MPAVFVKYPLHRRADGQEVSYTEGQGAHWEKVTSSLVRSDLPGIVWTVRGVYAPDSGTYKDQKLVTCFSRASGKADTPWEGDWESDESEPEDELPY